MFEKIIFFFPFEFKEGTHLVNDKLLLTDLVYQVIYKEKKHFKLSKCEITVISPVLCIIYHLP